MLQRTLLEVRLRDNVSVAGRGDDRHCPVETRRVPINIIQRHLVLLSGMNLLSLLMLSMRGAPYTVTHTHKTFAAASENAGSNTDGQNRTDGRIMHE